MAVQMGEQEQGQHERNKANLFNRWKKQKTKEEVYGVYETALTSYDHVKPRNRSYVPVFTLRTAEGILSGRYNNGNGLKQH
jgi:hypothetical protein